MNKPIFPIRVTDLVASPADGALLADCAAAVLLLDCQGGVVAVGPAAARLLESDFAPGALDHIAAVAQAMLARNPVEPAALTLPALSSPDAGDGPAERNLELVLLPCGAPDRHLLLLRDVTLEISLRQALTESRQRYKDLVEASSDFAWETGPDGTFVLVSSRGALGYEAGALLGQRPADYVIDAPEGGPLLPFETREELESYEFWFRDAAGTPACLIASCVPLFDDDGCWQGARGLCRDVTSARARDSELAAIRNRERLTAYVLRTIADVVNPGELLATAAAAVTRALGAVGSVIYRYEGDFQEAAHFGELPADLPDDLAVGGAPTDLDGDGGAWIAVATRFGGDVNGALGLWRPAGVESWTEDEREFLGDIVGHIAIVIEQAAQHAELERLSSTDALTGLDNRRAFFAVLEARLGADGSGMRASDRGPGALVYVDLDNFKQVNDVCGHQQGDTALKAVANILRRNTRAGDRVARLGGDEFALWLEATDRAGAETKAAALLQSAAALAEFAPPGGQPLGFSLGVALHDPGSSESLASLVARADEAMYAVKRAGKGQARIAPPVGGGER